MLNSYLLFSENVSFPKKSNWTYTLTSTRLQVAWRSAASKRAWNFANACHHSTDTRVRFNEIWWKNQQTEQILTFFHVLAAQPYCTIEQFQCLAKYSRNITEVRDCNSCELSCSNTVYDIEKLSKTLVLNCTMSGKFDAHFLFDPFRLNTDRSSSTYINIEFLTWPIIRYKREVLFGWVDLLVSFGGIAGLFLGFSLLSGVEIIYYFTMRAVCMLFQNKVSSELPFL